MHIKITPGGPGTWNLWVSASEDPQARPMYAAWGRSRDQIQTLLGGVLAEQAHPVTAGEVAARAARSKKPVTPGTTREAKSTALYTVLTVLDDWISGAKANHDAQDHKDNFDVCCGTFAPEDIRRMVNDAAAEVHVSEFPLTS